MDSGSLVQFTGSSFQFQFLHGTICGRTWLLVRAWHRYFTSFNDEHPVAVSNGLGNSDRNMVKFKISSENRPKDNLLLVPNFNQADFDSIKLPQINWKVAMANMNVF